MKFVSAFSTGKDSMLALHRMVKEGHEPIGLLVMYNSGAERSWFHGADHRMIERISESLGIPVYYGASDGNDYMEAFEEQLLKAKEAGAEACVFGDIDIENHREWDEARCKAAGLKAVLPLWNEVREDLVRETIREGYTCIIKCLHEEELPAEFLGKALSEEVLSEMDKYGIDLCGENGEYHTVVLDGPLFKKKIEYSLGEILKLKYVTAVDILVK